MYVNLETLAEEAVKKAKEKAAKKDATLDDSFSSSSRSKKFRSITAHPEGLLAGIAIGAVAGVLVLFVVVSVTCPSSQLTLTLTFDLCFSDAYWLVPQVLVQVTPQHQL